MIEQSWRIYGEPKPKGSMRWVGNRMVNDSPDCAKWIQDLRMQLTGHRPMQGPIRLEIRFYLSKPRRAARHSPAVKPDLDKLVRAVLDALTGHCYIDDGQVIEIAASKEYADQQGQGCHLLVLGTDREP